MMRLTPGVKNLLIINISLFFLTIFLELFGIDLYHVLGLHFPKSQYFNASQFITHMFMHGNFLHLFFNMYALYLFGTVLENVWQTKRFLFFYFATGIGAAIVHTIWNWISLSELYNVAYKFVYEPTQENFLVIISKYPEVFGKLKDITSMKWGTVSIYDLRNVVIELVDKQIDIPTVGASGAVFGLLLAFGVMFPRVPLYLFFIPIPIPAKYFVVGYGLLELINGLFMPGDGIAHFAHLGGMIFGYIILRTWYGNNITRN